LIQIKATSARSAPLQGQGDGAILLSSSERHLFEDDVGEEFSDTSHALQYGRRLASELADDGKNDSSVIVTDGGSQLFENPLPKNPGP
jgi:hypothetical protein